MPVLRDWNLVVDADMVLRGQGADPAAIRRNTPALVAYAEEAIAEGMPLVRPAVEYREFAVTGLEHERLLLDGGGELRGRLVAKHLAGAEAILAMLCTIGPDLEEYAAGVAAEDLLRGLALDGLGSAAAEALASAACSRFEAEAAEAGLHPTMPLNPGLIGWPVAEGQRQIFSLLDGSDIGVSLTESYLMLPRKTISLVLGLGPTAVPIGQTCDYCNLRESCRHRGLQH